MKTTAKSFLFMWIALLVRIQLHAQWYSSSLPACNMVTDVLQSNS
jgi:hypothetical protein